MRNWNLGIRIHTVYYHKFVLIVPMRNWNKFFAAFAAFWTASFDRTYEELKHRTGCQDDWPPDTVLIVPMRNWNSILGYLSPLSHCVLIVPMRNWNEKLSSSLCCSAHSFWSYLWGIETERLKSVQIEQQPFWSYLWGIETIHLTYSHDPRRRFDRTYEELKPVHQAADEHLHADRFDRTYEELKHAFHHL